MQSIFGTGTLKLSRDASKAEALHFRLARGEHRVHDPLLGEIKQEAPKDPFSVLAAGVDRWDSELAEMNAGKEGGRYVYPEVFVRLLGYMRVLFQLPYRQTEGFLTT